MDNSFKEEVKQTFKGETKTQISFLLNEGSFSFIKSFKEKSVDRNEGFSFKYRDLNFLFKQGDEFLEIQAKLLDFNIGMLTTINKFNTFIPVTLRDEVLDKTIDKNNILFLKYRKNEPTDEVNSKLEFFFVCVKIKFLI